MRTVEYIRHEFQDKPEAVSNSLLAFVYDIPYFSACGVFPPLRLLNQQLLRGGSEGGMSPGATWQPFSLSDTEYQDLVTEVSTIQPATFRDQVRYAHVQYIVDHDFDGDASTYPVEFQAKGQYHGPLEFAEYFIWMNAVCAKHRERHRAALRSAGFMK